MGSEKEKKKTWARNKSGGSKWWNKSGVLTITIALLLGLEKKLGVSLLHVMTTPAAKSRHISDTG
jgi:hypothetical protein